MGLPVDGCQHEIRDAETSNHNTTDSDRRWTCWERKRISKSLKYMVHLGVDSERKAKLFIMKGGFHLLGAVCASKQSPCQWKNQRQNSLSASHVLAVAQEGLIIHVHWHCEYWMLCLILLPVSLASWGPGPRLLWISLRFWFGKLVLLLCMLLAPSKNKHSKLFSALPFCVLCEWKSFSKDISVYFSRINWHSPGM